MSSYMLVSCIYDYVVGSLRSGDTSEDLRAYAIDLIRLKYLGDIAALYGDLADAYIYHTAEKISKVVECMEV